MKKTWSTLSTITLLSLFFSICFSEGFDFSYRNGIRFGDSIESVQSKEPESFTAANDPNILGCFDTLSGISNSTLTYFFEYDKLHTIDLHYGDDILDDALVNYNTIDEGLIRKYGQPVENVENATTYIGGAFEIMKSMEKYYSDNKEYAKNQWIVVVDEEHKIVIEHVLFCHSYLENDNSNQGTKVEHRLTYQYLDIDAKPTDFIDKDL